MKTPPEGWHAWTENQLASAQVTLVVCTEALHRQVELLNRQRATRGGSSDALGLLVDQWTRDPSRFRPVIPDGADEQWIPAALRSCTQFRYGSDYADLLRHLESLSQPGAMRDSGAFGHLLHGKAETTGLGNHSGQGIEDREAGLSSAADV